MSKGEEGWIRGSVFYLENDNGRSSPRVYRKVRSYERDIVSTFQLSA